MVSSWGCAEVAHAFGWGVQGSVRAAQPVSMEAGCDGLDCLGCIVLTGIACRHHVVLSRVSKMQNGSYCVQGFQFFAERSIRVEAVQKLAPLVRVCVNKAFACGLSGIEMADSNSMQDGKLQRPHLLDPRLSGSSLQTADILLEHQHLCTQYCYLHGKQVHWHHKLATSFTLDNAQSYLPGSSSVLRAWF